MARGVKWGCSYKRTTLFVCSINIFVALYVLRSLYASLYLYSNNDFNRVVKYTPDQIRKMEESIRIRRAKEPLELVKIVKELKEEFNREETVIELPKEVKNKITDEILERLRSLNANANISEQRNAVENWRKEKLQELKMLARETEGLTSSILKEEAGILVRALESDWAVLSENIGLWVPAEVIHQEHDDKPEGEEEPEEEVLPGRPLPPECHAELHTDYDGAAVRWGLTHHKESAADCCQACLDQAKYAKPGEKKCNTWVYCPSETGCYSPDIYQHKNQECWLKYAEKPKLNFKDRYSESYRDSHPNAPLIVPWVSGVVSA
ncbi:PREDICTED: uncharacterized protein LOC105120641 isoform X1 [Populus euphratica]|uniref:Uncharacterized protein LOC105120641 isoform X1 n=2 Tax=Populus euphratica TaxID=75702 RepID=A0AAJ6TTC3_POPEU|nr:PREDICTED: uncharacterized protein LOC105120641 isoform X1 [Populus euphratica]XP_011017223.1 PREDICTED: uncharacterized protein LOC105120641 isoform X1 [Populus euphratica]